MNESTNKKAHVGLRGLNGLALLAMAVIVGGIGAEIMTENIGWGLLLQLPLYAVIGLCWGTFTAAPWAKKAFLPGYAGAALVTLALYVGMHADHIAVQWETWINSFVEGSSAAATWFFGPPAFMWLIVFFIAAPVATFLKMTADGEKSFTDYLLSRADETEKEEP